MLPPMTTEPIWLSVARAFVGIHEQPGPVSNPVILRWAADLRAPAWYVDDDQAWCALWMNRLMMACQLRTSGAGFSLLRAASFATWGQPLATPELGAVLVFTRPSGAHVGLYLGETDVAYRVLGANQSNAVSETWIAKPRLQAIRWPRGVEPTTLGAVSLAAAGAPASGNDPADE